jgi:hypothetical protein
MYFTEGISQAVRPIWLLVVARTTLLLRKLMLTEERTTMTRNAINAASWMMLVLALGIYGCGPAADTAADSAASSEESGDDDHGDHDHEGEDHDEADHDHEGDDHGDEDADDVEASINKLPEADQVLARAQVICPVGGRALGDMGMPIKVDLDGRAVFVCCEHCIEDLKADPAKFLAVLDAPAEGAVE